MSQLNPLLEDGMVVWKGPDPRRGYCVFTLHLDRYSLGRRSICFQDMIPAMEKLGIPVEPHWTDHGKLSGWLAARGLRHHHIGKEYYDHIQIDPIVQSLLQDETTNTNFKSLLSLDE